MSMNYVLDSESVDITIKVVQFIFLIWLAWERKTDKTNTRITQLSETVEEWQDKFAERVTRIESAFEQHPTHDHLAEVYQEMRKITEAVSNLAVTMATINASLEAVREQTRLMDKFWRDHDPHR